jgi:hypothetical protein
MEALTTLKAGLKAVLAGKSSLGGTFAKLAFFMAVFKSISDPIRNF